VIATHPLQGEGSERLSSDRKEEAVGGAGLANSEHQVSPFVIVSSIVVHPRMLSCIVIPVIPGSPVTVIGVPVSFAVVGLIMPPTLVGMFSVSMMTGVIVTIRNGRESDCQKTE
jgi:hypothetical protein